jgi:hypothetical protein
MNRIVSAESFAMVGVAQLVRVPDCDSGCRGFESHRPPQFVVVGEGVFLTPLLLETEESDSRAAREIIT